MASFNNVVVTGNDWVNVNTLSTAPVGTAISVQNIGTANVRLQEASVKPANDNGGVLFTPEYGDNSKAIVAAGSLAIWAKLTDVNKPSTLAVFE